MKKLLFILFVAIVGIAKSQGIQQRTSGSTTVQDARLSILYNLILPRFYDTSAANTSIGVDSCGAKILTYEGGINKEWIRKCSPKRWVQNSTSEDLPDLSNYIQKQTQSPTASISPTSTLSETMPAGADISGSLLCTEGRLAATTTANATANITSVMLNGSPVTFANPSAGGESTQSVNITYPRNTTTTFTLLVTTADGKIATTTSTYTFKPSRYWGYSSTSTPSSSDIVAALGGGSELSNLVLKTNFTVTVTGTNKYIWYAVPTSEGHITSIITGGTIETIAAFTEQTVSVTSATGAVQNYYVVVANPTYSNTTFKFDSIQ